MADSCTGGSDLCVPTALLGHRQGSKEGRDLICRCMTLYLKHLHNPHGQDYMHILL